MPFLDEKELAALRQEIHDANVKKDELEESYNEKLEKLEDAKYASRNWNIVLSVLLGTALGFAYYFYKNRTVSNVDVSEIKKTEASRILDSISSIQLTDNYTEEESEQEEVSIEEAATAISNQLDGQTVYSVQIGVFTKKKHALLSDTFAGTVSKGDIFKYSVGLFKSLKEAQDFRRELVKIGFDDAFVASYINGVRQKIHQPN